MSVTSHPDDSQHTDCQKIRQILARVGEKWSVLVIMLLADRPHRFTEIKNAVDGISQRMLTLCLRGLERDGLVKRTVLGVMPPHVEYELTQLGRSLTEPVFALGTWASRHIDDIDTARAAFDAREEDQGNSPPGSS
ncbi:helix-turn-helix domain-containing protein [Burkholderia sp. Bp9142]|uniref:winged helix-turn-helix transcriptional regulator n=1 Tax=Burkholderia sp. Bp9142 TaxID=2184573 RepID=UPI000F5AD0AD|nr:helix-turn-helix domain-containing protein [Burkholderia sp. Bp9142]RQR23746.1 transcriptional regulator [Burkholderia sp. Bp9142]